MHIYTVGRSATGGQSLDPSLDQALYCGHCIDYKIVSFIAEILLDLWLI